jgi:hypothetical protein
MVLFVNAWRISGGIDGRQDCWRTRYQVASSTSEWLDIIGLTFVPIDQGTSENYFSGLI